MKTSNTTSTSKEPVGTESCVSNEKQKSNKSNADNPLPFTRWITNIEGENSLANVSHNFEFTVNRCVKKVWPIFMDFRKWQQDMYYVDSEGNECVIGDEEGNTLSLSARRGGFYEQYIPESWPKDSIDYAKPIRVRKVIPEKLIIIDACNESALAGYYVFTLHEENGKTKINISMIYAPMMVPVSEKSEIDERVQYLEGLRFNVDGRWNDYYIPTLKALLEEVE